MLSPLGVFLPANLLLSRGECKAGDLLEIDHTLYAHWAVFVGGHEVVHIPECEERRTIVERGSLSAVAGECLVRVNNKEVPARDRGLTPLAGEEVVARALASVGTLVCSNIVVSNSEHFATRMKYGVGWSDQAKAMQHSMTLLCSSPPTSARQAAKVHQDIWSEIHTILSSSPPVSPTSPSPTSPSPSPSSSSSSSSTFQLHPRHHQRHHHHNHHHRHPHHHPHNYHRHRQHHHHHHPPTPPSPPSLLQSSFPPSL